MATKLIAFDRDDLAVVSAHVQDASVAAADILWRQDDKRLVVGMRRLDWERMLAGEAAPGRRVSALRFDRVLSCQSRNIAPDAPDAALDLLGIEFHSTHPPGGFVTLMFAGDAALRLEVECLECELADLIADDVGTS